MNQGGRRGAPWAETLQWGEPVTPALQDPCCLLTEHAHACPQSRPTWWSQASSWHSRHTKARLQQGATSCARRL